MVKSYASLHPYLENTEETWQVNIEGASQIRIDFDAQTTTGSRGDTLQFLKDSSSSTYWGEENYSGTGGWPGVGEVPPLIVESDKFFVRFHSNSSVSGAYATSHHCINFDHRDLRIDVCVDWGNTFTAWGYSFTASADVAFKSDEADLDKLLRDLVSQRTVQTCTVEALECKAKVTHVFYFVYLVPLRVMFAKGDYEGAVTIIRRAMLLKDSSSDLRATARELEELLADEGVSATLSKAAALQAKVRKQTPRVSLE